MAHFDFTGYENFVIEDQVKSYLDTKLDMSKFLTVDNSLVGTDGLKVVVHKYVGSGSAEDLERGEGNSADIDATFVPADYTAARTQARTRYYDDDLFTDSTWVDAKLQYLAEAMVNDYNAKAIAEMATSSNELEVEALDFDCFADALGKFTEVHETEDGLMFLANIKLVPEIRKTLNENLMQTEGYIRTGAIGGVLGVPVYTSKIVPEDTMFLVTKDAVKDFVKSGVRVEQDRDKDTKENSVIADRYDVIALVDETKCIKIVKG